MLGLFKGRRWAREMAASIGAEAAGLAVDKLDRGGRRIIAGTPERSSHPWSVAVTLRSIAVTKGYG